MNDKIRLAILLVPIALALVGATATTTSSVFVDEEVVEGNELEVDDEYGLESTNSSDDDKTETTQNETSEAASDDGTNEIESAEDDLENETDGDENLTNETETLTDENESVDETDDTSNTETNE